MSQKKENLKDHPDDNNERNQSEENASESTGSHFSRRKIQCNWSKYVELPPVEPGELSDYYDYGYLSKTYSTDNNYFQLSSEKEWTKQTVIPNSTLFSLNLKKLSAGLACIPFYERIDIDKSLLSESCRGNCDNEAKSSLLKYKPELDITRTKQNNQQTNSPECITKDEQSEINNLPLNSLPTSPERNSTSVISSETITNENKHDEDLEDWLDSVLED